ncbi:hypothetical protein [Vibrio metoecus]|uniref:hypothetical protein n=1 Tax=Vibrio metoecus TaxID=1481663 RepID=UPI0012AD50A3|nr:hypothetical protein [Vibrio metoecus]
MTDEIDSIKYLTSVQSEIDVHKKGIRNVQVFISVVFTITAAYIGSLYYNQNVISSQFSLALTELNNSFVHRNDLLVKKLDSSNSTLLKEFEKYNSSVEKIEISENLQRIVNEFTGIRKYLTVVNERIIKDDLINKDDLEELILISQSILARLKNMQMEPFEKVSTLMEGHIELIDEFDSLEPPVVEVMAFYSRVEKLIGDAVAIKSSDYSLYIFVSLFLLLFAISISIYKYHHNQISRLNREKHDFLKVIFIVNSDLGGTRTHDNSLVEMLLSSTRGQTHESTNLTSPVANLVENVSAGLKKSP